MISRSGGPLQGFTSTKVDEVELGYSEGEEETPIKWQNYEIETLIIIRGKMEEKIA